MAGLIYTENSFYKILLCSSDYAGKDYMRIAFVIHTPGQEHFWHYPILILKERGNDVIVLARDYQSTCKLLHAHGIEFNIYGKAGSTSATKIMQLPAHFMKSFNIIRKFKPDIIAGAGIIEAYNSLILRKPCIIFEDTELTPLLERLQWKFRASVILTPDAFRMDFGKKNVRFAGYKEIAYLHPNYFKPDSTIYDELKISRGEKFVVLRFNAFDAVHDIGRHGFTRVDQVRLVKELNKYTRVFISPEGLLSKELEEYRLSIPYERIHHALYYAQLLITDTQTMTTEAAILGTPVVRCNSFVGPDDMGNFVELEQKYGLIYSFRETDQAMHKAIELIQQQDLKEQWAKKQQKLLADKIDVTQFMVDFIENYPESIRKYYKKKSKRL